MTIIRFDPFAINKPFFRPFFDEEEWPELTMTEGLNVYEEEGNIVVEAPVPGIPEDKLDITYEDGVLHIRGKEEIKKEEKKKGRIVHRMQRVSSFDYSTYLPRPIDDKNIDATVKNGVLTVKAPITEAAKPKRIQVRSKSK